MRKTVRVVTIDETIMVIDVIKNTANEAIVPRVMCSEIHIGDYVEIADTGCQYPSYTTAFMYFWGNNASSVNLDHIQYETDKIWKVINMAAHPTLFRGIICHIRNRKGDNAVIALEGLRKSKFHKRNREPIEKIVISQLPHIGGVQSHDWHEKLWEIYNSKKKFHSKI